MLDFNIALQSLVGLTIFLILLFLFLLGYTFWTRKKKQYWENYEQKFRDYFFSLLLDYAEQSDSHLDADAIIKKISKRSKDYAFFLKLLDELNNIVDGTERDRLQKLIEHPVFSNFYQKKLFERSSNSKIYACIYFQKSGHINSRVLAKLRSISKSQNLKLSYAATKALQASEDWHIRKVALQRFFMKPDLSELMVAELLHIFDSGLAKDREQVYSVFRDLLLKDINPEAKNIIVHYMGYQQFYESSEFLYQYLQRIHYSKEKVSLIRALIVALGELFHTESAPLIKQYCKSQYDMSICLASIKTLSTFGGKENISFLIEHLLQAEFPIRKTIIYECVTDDETRLTLLIQFVKTMRESLQAIERQKTSSKQLYAYLNKVSNIAHGIKIALNHQQMDSYAR